MKRRVKRSCFSAPVFQPALDQLAGLRIQHRNLLEAYENHSRPEPMLLFNHFGSPGAVYTTLSGPELHFFRAKTPFLR